MFSKLAWQVVVVEVAMVTWQGMPGMFIILNITSYNIGNCYLKLCREAIRSLPTEPPRHWRSAPRQLSDHTGVLPTKPPRELSDS